MNNPTINDLSETCSAIVSQQASLHIVEAALQAAETENKEIGQHYAKYLCDRAIITTIAEPKLEVFTSYMKQHGYTVLTYDELQQLKQRYPYHWSLEFNQDGSGEIKDPKADFHKSFKFVKELLA
ncbi:hypothetical protein [Photorhabdus khanii]|uniref:Uncharacterized protein n=1 Tax=Photorhabdus khanii subsp. guanajuatensis TaxID=2100166 RepID=A0A4R4IXH7_9GAMM|nr:hypothetical protein [Photorhabdus khanii]TDB45653.1 hypothetical protein C5467_21530 [Photorhabdus khanii subsp. guanajuatensis]